MRTITKRLTCTNRGNTNANLLAIGKIEARYLAKMTHKGWRADNSYRFAGDCGAFKFELIIRLIKG